ATGSRICPCASREIPTAAPKAFTPATSTARTGRYCCSCGRRPTWPRWRHRLPCHPGPVPPRQECRRRRREALPRSRRNAAATTAIPSGACRVAACVPLATDLPPRGTAPSPGERPPRKRLRRSPLPPSAGLARRGPGSAVAPAGVLERGQLLRRRLALVAGLPLVERLAVHDRACLVLVERDAVFRGRLAIPIGQAVAAEAGEDHQVDVLHV